MSEIGKVQLLVFHGVYREDGAITHYWHEFPRDLYRAIPHLYVVQVADRTGDSVRVRGFFFMKSSLLSNHPDFEDSLLVSFKLIDTFKDWDFNQLSLWASRQGEPEPGVPPSEMAMLGAAHEHYLRVDSRGRA
ncbi:hypothetical protein [Achromobacter sp. 413638]|uniref:hypothetical protein n=1 Tax=Achromobacter sp. 413638 TaxID=3342385 RepID=UPI00370C73DA